MIIDNSKSEIVGGSGVTDFKMELSAKAFSVFSDSLYENKIKAIIRELSTNALDSHKEANSNKPFYIKLPTELDPHFIIRDYGTGLTHDEVNSVYTTYFKSTKETTNEFIGALGLGSKTPFSYKNNFSIKSYKDGVLNTYTAIINSGIPSSIHHGSFDTDEENGLEISFSVDSKDVDRFLREAINVFYYFKEEDIPNCNLELDKAGGFYKEYKNAFGNIYVKNNMSYKFNKPNFSNRYIDVVMGNISYPVSLDLIFDKTDVVPEISLDFIDAICADIGDVNVAPSRESLHYDQSTINFLRKTILESESAIIKYLQDMFDACSDEREAYKKAKNILKYYGGSSYYYSSSLEYYKLFTYKGKPIKYFLNIPKKYLNCIDRYRYDYISGSGLINKTMPKFKSSHFMLETLVSLDEVTGCKSVLVINDGNLANIRIMRYIKDKYGKINVFSAKSKHNSNTAIGALKRILKNDLTIIVTSHIKKEINKYVGKSTRSAKTSDKHDVYRYVMGDEYVRLEGSFDSEGLVKFKDKLVIAARSYNGSLLPSNNDELEFVISDRKIQHNKHIPYSSRIMTNDCEMVLYFIVNKPAQKIIGEENFIRTKDYILNYVENAKITFCNDGDLKMLNFYGILDNNDVEFDKVATELCSIFNLEYKDYIKEIKNAYSNPVFDAVYKVIGRELSYDIRWNDRPSKTAIAILDLMNK